jgi:DNA recombination protein RmuC
MPIVTVVLLVIVVALLLALFMKTAKVGGPMIASRLDAFEKAQERTERAVREEIALSRDELAKAAREQRRELTEAFGIFGDSFAQRMVDVASVQKA